MGLFSTEKMFYGAHRYVRIMFKFWIAIILKNYIFPHCRTKVPEMLQERNFRYDTKHGFLIKRTIQELKELLNLLFLSVLNLQMAYDLSGLLQSDLMHWVREGTKAHISLFLSLFLSVSHTQTHTHTTHKSICSHEKENG